MRRTYLSIRLICVLGIVGVTFSTSVTAAEQPLQPCADSRLPSDSILSIVQVGESSLMVGTAAGLRELVWPFYCLPDEAPVTVADDPINSLMVTPDGALWVATGAGLYRQNADGTWSENLEQQANLDSIEIRSLYLAQDGAIWVGAYDGLARYSGGKWENLRIDNRSPTVNDIAEDPQQRMWIASPGLISIFAQGKLVTTLDKNDGLPANAEIGRILQDHAGNMWAATNKGLVWLTGLTVNRVFTTDDGLGSNWIRSIADQPEGSLWIGTDFGLTQLRDGLVQPALTSANGLAGDQIQSLFYDREGNLWIGTEAGLSRLPVGSWFSDRDPLLFSKDVTAVLPDTTSGDYAISAGSIIHRSPGGEWERVTGILPGINVYSLAIGDQGQIWAATDHGFVQIQENQVLSSTLTCASESISVIFMDSRQQLWVGTDNGIAKFDLSPSHPNIQNCALQNLPPVRAIWETHNHDIWVGLLSDGARRYRNGVWLEVNAETTQSQLSSNTVINGIEDTASNLWFGTLDDGVYRLSADMDPSQPGAWKNYTFPVIAGDRVNGLWEDRNHPGNIWVAAVGGLNLIRGDDPPSLFTSQDGINLKRVNALDQDRKGIIWFGTALGLIYHKDAHQRPAIYRADVLVNGMLVDANILKEGLPYRTQRLEFSLFATDLGDLTGLRYCFSSQFTDSSGGPVDSRPLSNQSTYSLPLTPGATYSIAASAVDREFNESAIIEQVILVRSPTPLEAAIDFLGPWGVAILLFAVVSGGVGTLLYQRAQIVYGRYPFHILQISFQRVNQKDTAQLKIKAFFISPIPLPAFLQPVMHRLPFFGRPWRVKFTDEGIPVDLTPLRSIRNIQKRLDSDQPHPNDLQCVGETLYRVLTGDQRVIDLLEHLGLGRRRLRLELDFHELPELFEWPWECLCAGKGIGFLSCRSDTAIIRHPLTEVSKKSSRGAKNKKLRCLILFSLPTGFDEIDLFRAEENLSNALGDIKDKVETSWEFGERAETVFNRQARSNGNDKTAHEIMEKAVGYTDVIGLKDKLDTDLARGYDILHFIGHAEHKAEEQEGSEIFLWFEDEHGDPLDIGKKELNGLLEKMGEKVPRLVILSACRTADMGSQLIDALLQNGVRAVVGMQWPVMEQAAVKFATGFYASITGTHQVDYSISIARSLVAAEVGDGQRDWASPMIVVQSDDLVIFD
jgi:ligand-binding sensor domain-containing protein